MEQTDGVEFYIKSPQGFEMAYRLSGVFTVDQLAVVSEELAGQGFQRSERLDKPVRGGGGNPNWKPEKPEQKAPDERVPEHCGQKMKYVSWEKDGKTFEKYECRADKKDCPQAGDYKFSIWRDRWVKELASRAPAVANGQSDNPFDAEPDPLAALR